MQGGLEPVLAGDVADHFTRIPLHSLPFEQRRKVKVSPAYRSSAAKLKLNSLLVTVRSPRPVRQLQKARNECFL